MAEGDLVKLAKAGQGCQIYDAITGHPGQDSTTAAHAMIGISIDTGLVFGLTGLANDKALIALTPPAHGSLNLLDITFDKKTSKIENHHCTDKPVKK
jgi:hypothetical protein